MGTQVAIQNSASMIAPCPSKKKSFTTENEAVQFEERNRAKNGTVKQFAYAVRRLRQLPPVIALTGCERSQHNYNKLRCYRER